ncbi:leucine-rich repeat domain-containing protein [Pseudomonas sichuanensis]|uniref:NEL-type E3 ubiquitin ligase domain-containing protein n=1 Tax=Pseudomonas sichuanensis TaxID=2213015 RepID=UPI002160A824|nr:NEL-type E3 ubiquitin ligase domain-containing protein [Pseudomonas sichuanensis]UVK81476.1 leucine-rich repeat domain-containing protein [Pseudomonas sichuanensis]
MHNPFIPHVTVDTLIAQRMPPWLAGLSQEQRVALQQALVLQQQVQHHLQQLLGVITPLEDFAENLLDDAMTLITDEQIDVRGAKLLSVWREVVVPAVASLPLTWRTHRSEQTLLAAALHNFSEDELDAKAFHADTRLTDDLGDVIEAFKPEQYAWLCRRLDVGGQYQRYLKTHFEPEDAAARQRVEQQLEAVQRANFDAAVQLALGKGQLDALSGRQLRPLLAQTPLVPAEPTVLIARQLYLLGKRVIGVVTLEVRRSPAPDAAVDGVIAWIPGDPQGAVSRHSSWGALYQALARRFRQPGYPAFFQRFLAQSDRIAFERVLAGLLADKTPLELDGRNLEVEGELFVRLRQDQVGKILADARVLAVPTDDEDRRSRSERLEGYRNAGLGLLNLAALFVPGLGLAMLGVAALDIVKEVYEGYEDWQIGDREGALNHLFGVAENVAANALLMAGGAALGKADATDARRIVKGAEGYLAIAADGLAPVTATAQDSLIKALLLHMDPVQQLSLAGAPLSERQLSDLMLARAVSQREAAAGLIGLAPVGGGIRPPVRLGDGRLGYPLSGRAEGGRHALRHALRQIHPEFTDTDLSAYIADQLRRQVNLWDQVTALQRQLPLLEQHLTAWRQGALGRSQQRARKRMAKYLLRSWRRQSLALYGEQVHLSIEGEALGGLPALPASVRFDSVTRLVLRNLELDDLNPAFFGRFGMLQRLDLRGNRLTGLPVVLEQLANLEELDLADNRIVLGPENIRRLERLGQLRQLNLNRNPLVAAPRLEGLTRLRHLSLRGTRLTEVPQALARLPILEYADLRDNRIDSLDDAFFGMPARSIERIFLHDNPLDLRSEARLSAFLQAESHRMRRLVRHSSGAAENREAWVRLLEPDERLLRGLQWDSLVYEPGAADFFQLLADLRGTEDFLIQRGDLTARVWMVVEGCAGNAQLRAQLFELAGHPRTCSDSVAMNFSLLEVQSWVHLNTAGLTGQAAERGLQRLGRSLFRLDEVDRAASAEIAWRTAQGADFDEVQVRLRYRVGLAHALDLPGQPLHMRFPNSAEVSPRDLLRVRSQVLTAERTPSLATSVAQREFWQAHLRDTHAQRFEQADQPFHAQLEALNAADLAEGEYLSRVEAVARARDAAMQALIETLTQEIFTRNPL